MPKLKDSKVAYFDLETTGFSRYFDHIVEVAIVSRNPDNTPATSTYHKYIEPPCTIPKQASRVHGIDERKFKELRKQNPERLATIEEVVEDIHAIFSKVDYSCAYNGISFDIPFLHTLLKRHDKSIPKSLHVTRCIDPLLVLRCSENEAAVSERFKTLKLTDISKGLERPEYNAHAAIDDTKELALVMKDLISTEIISDDVPTLLRQQCVM